MHAGLAYILMYISAAFYCGFDTVVKNEVIKHSDNSTISNSIFNPECDVQECLGKTLKLFDNNQIIEDGWLVIAAVFSGFDSKATEAMKKELKRCLPGVNQQLNSIPKCSKFQVGAKLLESCVDKKTMNFR